MRLLDAFSCAGGAGMGYHRAGFEVVGVDIEPQPNYPFEHHVGDAVEFIQEHGHEYDAIHASPPCQSSSVLTKGTNQGRVYPDLIEPTREALEAIGKPYVIENVVSAEVRPDLILCGEMFGLDVQRHRLFELGGWFAMQPPHSRHRGKVQGYRHGVYYDGPYFPVYGEGGDKGTINPVAAGDGDRLDRRPQGDRRSDPARLHPVHR